MIPESKSNIIVKYLSKEATLDELIELSKWLENQDNLKKFNAFVKANFLIENAIKNYDNQNIKKNVLEVIKKEKYTLKRSRTFANFYKIAAVLVVFLTIGGVLFTRFYNSDTQLKIQDENVTLVLGNGAIKTLDLTKETLISSNSGEHIGVQSGNTLAYNKHAIKDELIYNTINVPYGKRFEVNLSDGTMVHLNAGSSLKYPVKFIKGERREVFLKGEAFFDVAKDKNHAFVVNANAANIQVLGTKFNVSSYKEDIDITTALVEGSIAMFKKGVIYNPSESINLKPGQEAIWNKETNEAKVSSSNLESRTAWMNGELILYEVPFKSILKKIERQYNVSFINNNKALNDRIFTAKFDVEDIYAVLKSLSVSGGFTYTVNEDKIIINP
ncbi:FecR family protein [Neotamlana sedimentorum]|uniref:FecR family protein n=1 Tax=Neotamlana sedimentorum TaxID=1435349 RepID=UPI00069BBE5C|nr:FecR domain-containing protein [Tamlana sedimentorum]